MENTLEEFYLNKYGLTKTENFSSVNFKYYMNPRHLTRHELLQEKDQSIKYLEEVCNYEIRRATSLMDGDIKKLAREELMKTSNYYKHVAIRFAIATMRLHMHKRGEDWDMVIEKIVQDDRFKRVLEPFYLSETSHPSKMIDTALWYYGFKYEPTDTSNRIIEDLGDYKDASNLILNV